MHRNIADKIRTQNIKEKTMVNRINYLQSMEAIKLRKIRNSFQLAQDTISRKVEKRAIKMAVSLRDSIDMDHKRKSNAFHRRQSSERRYLVT